MNEIINWLIEGPAWIRYRTLIDLLNAPESDKRVIEAKIEMALDPLVNGLRSDALAWESRLLKRHNDAEHPLHKIAFLAELGFTKEDPNIKRIAEIVMSHRDARGPFYSLSNYPTHFGGSGRDEWLWVLCDAPLLTYALIKFGYSDLPEVRSSLDYMKTLVKGNGWPCAACENLGKFRGPGKKDDPCPYANLIMLKALTAAGDISSKAVTCGVNTLLALWEHSRSERPFLFKMGTDFRKLKVPFIWYDILHVADVLSHFPLACGDSRYMEMVDVIQSKADDDGRYTSESIWTKWKGWEFCQKKEPSRWLTLCVYRILIRALGKGKV